MTTSPYIRQVELIVGPLPEYKGGGEKGDGIRIFGDGSSKGLRIKFAIHKHVMSTATPSVISVYNLSQELRTELLKSDIQLSLSVGWQNTKLTPIFTGSLLACTNNRQGADIVSNLISLSGYGGMNRAVTYKTFSEGVSLSAVVQDLANSIPGIVVDPTLISVPDIKLGSGGRSISGTSKIELDKLARNYGFGWWIDGGKFYALSDQTSFSGGKAKISYKNGFLIRAEPLLVPPFQKIMGVSIHSILNPDISPGRKVTLESKINPKLNGDHVVHTLMHVGDTHSNQWESNIESLFLGGQ